MYWRNFLWKDNKGTKRSHLVNWSKVTKPKEKRGLDISKLHDTNLALLSRNGYGDIKWNLLFFGGE